MSPPNAYTDHEKKAQEIINWTVSEGTRDFSALHAAIASALREAEAGERERCAKIAENWKSSLRPGTEARLFGHQEAARSIAAAIRSRNDE